MRSFLFLRIVPILLFLVLSLSLTTAVDSEPLEEECSLSNLDKCLIDVFFDSLLDLINTPLSFILNIIEDLLAEPIDTSLYNELWLIIIYIISMFYGLLLVFSGLLFMISGHDIAKRALAKTWLKNILLMIVMVQASYLLYGMILDVNTALTSFILSLIDSNFFLFTMDSFGEVALELTFGAMYLTILIVTLVVLAIRYLVVSFGVILFPIGIFLYYFGPLKSIGKSILIFLLINIFMSFFACLVLLAGSMIIGLSLFDGYKVLVMIASFALIDILFAYFILHGLIMAVVSVVFGFKTFGMIKVVQKVVGGK
jgi:hypothetical protein